MFGNPSLMTRIAIGKAIGFLFGLAGFNVLPYFLADAGSLLRWGVLLQTSRPLNKNAAIAAFLMRTLITAYVSYSLSKHVADFSDYPMGTKISA